MTGALRRFRTAAKWRQTDLAKHSGLDQGTVSRLERGLTKRPGMLTLTAIADSLNTRFRSLHKRQRVRPEQLVGEERGYAIH